MRSRRLVASLLSSLLFSGCVAMQPAGYNPHFGGPATLAYPQRQVLASAATVQAAAPRAPHRVSEWDRKTMGAHRHAGFVPVWERDSGATGFELSPDLFEQELGFSVVVNRGVAEAGVHDGLPLTGTMLVRFVRAGDRVLLIARDRFLVAPEGTGWANGVERNRAESVIAALPVLAEDPEGGALLVDAGGFLTSDLGGIGHRLAGAYEGKEPGLDRERSRITEVHGFPRNTEIDSQLTFVSNVAPPYGFYGVADPHVLSLGARFSFFALPDRPMVPRLADDRVGYFSDVFFDPSRARKPWIAYLNRRRLEKKYPDRAVSEPVEPIVYYIDPSVPEEWRPYVKQGVLAWNAAFARLGFEGAVQVRDQLPEDYSPDDIRYSTIRWVPSFGGAWGLGPSRTDPRTGEILDSDIIIGGNVLRSGDLWNSQLIARTPAPAADGCAMAESASRGLVQADLLLGAAGRTVPKELVGDVLRNLITHEVGHTLGLRHNFRSSATIPHDRLNDKEFTGENGVCNSVMDYCDINVASDPSKQGYFVSPGLGAYDRWAIEYGYRSFAPAAEAAGLETIASDSTDPLHAFETDEDLRASDAATGAFDLGDDPLRFAQERIGLIDAAIPRLETSALEDGDSFFELRHAFGFLLSVRQAALDAPVRLIGGSFVARVHKGQKGETPVFTPVPAERQRAALRLVIERAFAPGAWPLPADVLVRLAPWYGGLRGGSNAAASVDYPAHRVVLGLETEVLYDLLDPARLTRMIDGTLVAPAGTKPLTVSELLATLTDGIWTEVVAGGAKEPDSFRADLQLAYIDTLGILVLPPAMGSMPRPRVPIAPWDVPVPEAPVPAEARAAARAELTRLAARVDAALRGKRLSARGRAHLEEAKARIARTLGAGKTIVVK